jgi:hypothetical protein
MKKLLPILALLMISQAKAQTQRMIDPETGQPIGEDCSPIIKTSPNTVPLLKSNILPVSLTDVYAHNVGLNNAEKQMVKEFVDSCRPFLNKFYAIYFFIGDDTTAHKINFINPFDNGYAFSLQFPNGATHDEDGVFFEGPQSQYANTQMIPALMLDDNVGASYYLLNTVPGGTIISNGTGNFSIWRRDYDGNAYGYIGESASGIPVPDYRGFGTIQRNGNTIEVFNSGVLSGSVNSAAPGSISSELPIKLSQNYTNPQANSLRWGFAAIHQTLTPDEQLTLFNAVELMQVKEGREVSPL